MFFYLLQINILFIRIKIKDWVRQTVTKQAAHIWMLYIEYRDIYVLVSGAPDEPYWELSGTPDETY